MCGNEIRRLKIVMEGTLLNKVTEFDYLGNKISEYKKDMEYKLQTYNNISEIIETNFGKQMRNQTKTRNTQRNSENRSQIWKYDMVLNKRDKNVWKQHR
jgi:hypothetical protein